MTLEAGILWKTEDMEASMTYRRRPSTCNIELVLSVFVRVAPLAQKGGPLPCR